MTSDQFVSKRMVPDSVENLAFTPDGERLFVAGSLDGFQEWQIDTLDLLKVFDAREARDLAISPDGTVLATLTGSTIKLWDLGSNKLLNILSSHKDIITGLVFSPDGAMLASVSGVVQGDVLYTSDNSLRLWDVRTGKQIAVLEGEDHLYSVAISPDGKLIATGSSNGIIQLWDAVAKVELGSLTASPEIILSLAFSSDGSLLFAGDSGDTIYIWDVKAKEEVRKLTGHLGRINRLILNKDGTMLISSSDDGTVRAWAVN
ncbi:MAG: WD40 repeat domain-containing protein [Anaerolineae bacterium]